MLVAGRVDSSKAYSAVPTSSAALIQCLDPVVWVAAAATEFTLLNCRRNNRKDFAKGLCQVPSLYD